MLFLVKTTTIRRRGGINEKEETIGTSNSESLQVRQAQVRLLFKSSLITAATSVVAASFLASLQWNHVNSSTIIVWLSVMSAIIVARIFCYLAFKQSNTTLQHIHMWEKIFITLSSAAAITWGIAGVVLFPESNFQYQAATIVILAGMSAGATTTLSALRAPVFIFVFLVMSPLIIQLLLESSQLSISFALMCTVYSLFLTSAANTMYKNHLENITLRIKSLGREETILKSEQFMRQTAEILEMIAKGEPAKNIYHAIALLYESRHFGMRCSLLELRGNTLVHGGAPSLPKAYCDQVDGLENGPNVGSCGTATYTGKRVLVDDIATDPKWEKLKDITLPHGMRCCWSEPIIDNKGKVLGAFGMYYNHPALPNSDELADLEAGARLAGIVMTRQRRECLLQKLHSAFEYTQEAIIISDLDARLEYVNPAFEKMTGYNAQEAVGQFIKILRSNKHPQSFYDQLLDHDQSGKPWHGEITIKCKDGSMLEVERTVSPVLDEQGNTLFLVAIQRDLTEHKLLEAQFLQAQKMDAIGTLVGGIAHDFNNILAGMSGNLYLAKKFTEKQPKVQHKLDNVESLTFRAADLIQQLLTFARKGIVHMKPMLLEPFFKEVMQFTNAVLPPNINVQYNFNAKTMHINGDAVQLHQVLLNLITNARDAVESVSDPSIKIQVDAFDANKQFILQHTYFKPGTYMHLSVADNGIGISPTHLKHIFEPFFTSKEQGKGTGLGLSMTFGAVKTHQGFIEVESEEGKGSTFHIYIPAQEEGALTPATEENTKPTKGQGEWILLVDDELEIREAGKEVLEVLGYQVLLASDGLEAVAVFSAHQNDIALVLIDVVMPKLGGVDAIKRIKSIRSNVAVIFATGYDKETTFPEHSAPDDRIVLSKPYNIDEVSLIIKQKIRT